MTSEWARLLAFVFVSVASHPASAASFKFPTQTLTVPDGFTIELVAAPPLVNRPISIDFDEQGRLYATDSSGLSERADKQIEQKPHRIVRLESTKHDGRFDRATVFADKMMFPQGALFHEGSLYVAAPPHIWKLTDTNNDGVADRREIWWDGGTLTGCANDVHGPYRGPDGWFYWTKGAFAEQKHTLGDGTAFVSRAAHIYRARPDGSRLEPIMTGGMDNPVGISFTPTGDRILSGTFFITPSAGQRDGLIHALYGGVYGKENTASAGHPRTGDLMPLMTHMGAAAPCGSTAYRSAGFGRDYTGNHFVCYFNLRKVTRHILVPDGATFKTLDADFVTSDSPDFHPTDVLEDADGSLLIVDTGGWYKICCPSSQLSKPDVLGGIYRIKRIPNFSPPKAIEPETEQVFFLKISEAIEEGHSEFANRIPTFSAAMGIIRSKDCLAWLSSGRIIDQDCAIHLIRTDGGYNLRGDAITATDLSVRARRNLLWALADVDTSLARETVRVYLRDKDPSVVQVALHVASLWRDPEAAIHAMRLINHEDLAIARLAAEVLGRSRQGSWYLFQAAARLAGVARTATGTPLTNSERAFEHSLIYALIEIGDSREVRSWIKDVKPAVRRVALVALDQMPGANLQPADVLPSLNSTDQLLRNTAAWIVAHRSEWGEALAQHFRERLAQPAPDELPSQLAPLASAPAIQQLLAETLGTANRLIALAAMRSAKLKETPTAWLDALVPLLARPARGEAVGTARVLPLPKGGHPALLAALADLGRDSAIDPATRLDALVIAAPALKSVDGALLEFLRSQLDTSQPAAQRAAAASTLAKVPLDPAQQLALAHGMAKVGALEAPKLLPAFERKPTAALGLALVEALRNSPGLAGLRVAQLKPLFAKYPAEVQAAAAPLLASLNADLAQRNARIDALLPTLAGGDINRGHLVFNSEKTACTLCHKIGYRGGLLGPDLTSIGKIRSERDLLEAIVFPSATLVRGYEPVTVTTRIGESHTGLVRQDDAEAVVLATGPDSTQRIPRFDVADMQPSNVSPMPPGMDAVLTTQELADLLAFLKSRS